MIIIHSCHRQIELWCLIFSLPKFSLLPLTINWDIYLIVSSTQQVSLKTDRASNICCFQCEGPLIHFLNNEARDHMPVRIPDMLVSCRDLIRRQHRRCITLPLLSAPTDVQEVHARVNYALFVCIQHVHMLFVLKNAAIPLHPLALYLQFCIEFLPKPEWKSVDEEVQEYSICYLLGGGN